MTDGDVSALVAVLPEVGQQLDRWRRLYDPSGRIGLTAHVTVLVPFVSPDRLDSEVRTALRDLFARRAAFDVAFLRTARFPTSLWLVPEPEDSFVALTGAIHARWPEHPPYEGAFTEVIPHLTVAHECTEEEFAAIDREVSDLLPIRTRVEEVQLYVGSNTSGWEPIDHFRLGDTAQ